jgi:hypothetical protein
MVGSINTSARDKGLRECLESSGLDSILLQAFLKEDGITRWKTLEAFVYTIDPDDVTGTINILLNNFPDYKKSANPDRPNFAHMREAGHLRQAYRAAKALVDQLAETPPDADVDLDAPLPPSTHEDLSLKWQARYNFKLRAEYTPDEATLTRYYRALQKTSRNRSAMKVFEMQKHTAVGNTSGLSLALNTSGNKQIRTLFEWYCHARVMAYALAMTGNFLYQCVKDGEVLMSPLDTNQNYVDNAYEHGVVRDSLAWLNERDKQTRAVMCHYMRQGYSQGAALGQAWEDTKFHWLDSNLFSSRGKATLTRPGAPAGLPTRETPRAAALVDDRPPLARPTKAQRRAANRQAKADQSRRERSRSRSRTPRRPWQRDAVGATARRWQAAGSNPYCPQGKDGVRLCPEWNMGKKCKTKPCKLVHNKCNRRLLTGGACGQKHRGKDCTNPSRVPLQQDDNVPEQRTRTR